MSEIEEKITQLIQSQDKDSINLGLFLMLNSPEIENWRELFTQIVKSDKMIAIFLVKYHDFVPDQYGIKRKWNVVKVKTESRLVGELTRSCVRKEKVTNVSVRSRCMYFDAERKRISKFLLRASFIGEKTTFKVFDNAREITIV